MVLGFLVVIIIVIAAGLQLIFVLMDGKFFSKWTLIQWLFTVLLPIIIIEFLVSQKMEAKEESIETGNGILLLFHFVDDSVTYLSLIYVATIVTPIIVLSVHFITVAFVEKEKGKGIVVKGK